MIKHLFRLAIAINVAGVLVAATPPGSAAAPLLERAGDRVKQFWEEFAGVTCTESLSQEKLKHDKPNDKGKTVLRNSSRYDYLILLGWDGGQLWVDESRVEVEAPRKARPGSSLLATRGFATLLLILHPEFQYSYSFSLPVAEEGDSLARIDFTPRSTASTLGRSPGALELKGREYPIAWEGSAWIDPATAAIVRIEARWKEPPKELGLESLTSDVRYGLVELRPGTAYWLPQSALIELHTPHQGWRNLHEFSKYRSFDVKVEDNVGGQNPGPADTGLSAIKLTAADSSRAIVPKNKGGKLIIAADSDFLTAQNAHPGNIAWLQNVVDWFGSQEDLISIRTRQVVDRSIKKEKLTKASMFGDVIVMSANMAFGIGLVIIVGLIIYFGRREELNKAAGKAAKE